LALVVVQALVAPTLFFQPLHQLVAATATALAVVLVAVVELYQVAQVAVQEQRAKATMAAQAFWFLAIAPKLAVAAVLVQ
jgi:xanthine/uracil/vitamin C permease (AzgA family)